MNVSKSLLPKSPLPYLKTLPIPSWIPFGLELEFARANVEVTNRRIKNHHLHDTWNSKEDVTCTKQISAGGEVASPVIYNTKNTWEDVHKILYILKSGYAKITGDTSFQISIDLCIFMENPMYLLRFLKLWTLYEPEIYQFCYGEFLEPRAAIRFWAIPCGSLFMDYIENILPSESAIQNTIDPERIEIMWYQLYKILQDNTKGRYYGLNVDTLQHSHKKRLEIRVSNGTLDGFIIQNTLIFFTYFIETVKNDSIDWCLLEKEWQHYVSLYLDSKAISRVLLGRDPLYGSYQRGIVEAPMNIPKALFLQELLYKDPSTKELFMKQYTKKF